jgi:tetratricopeptide (TPR) repeat protein
MSEQALRGWYWAGVIVFALAIWVISLIHNWGGSTWPQLGTAPLELKDVITIVVSTSAFLISAGVAVFNWWSWRQKNIEEAKKGLTDTLVGMITARQKLEEFRLQSGEKYGDFKSNPYRIALSDQRHLYLSKALQLIHRHEKLLSLSHFDYLMLAANLIDLGRTAESVQFYEKAMHLAKENNDLVGSASARRVYGRAKIASGDYDQGRKEMLAAANEYQALASRRAYDRDRMLAEAAETYQRLIRVEMQADQVSHLRDDLSAMEILTKKVRDPIRVGNLTSALDELRTLIDAPGQRPSQALSLAEPPRQSAE